jgi:hypothetical protein
MNPAPAVWLVTNGVALALLVGVLGAWARRRPRVRRQALPGAVCVALAALLLLLFFKPGQVPTGWITVFMEGRSIRNIQQLYGQGSHFGAGFSLLGEWLTGHDVTTFRAVVHANLCLAAVNTIIFYFLASYVLHSWWVSLLFVLGYTCNLNTLHAGVSETPVMLWTTHFFLGCIAAAVIDDESAALWLRRLAVLWLAVLVWLAGQLRSELLVLGVPAVGAGVLRAWGWEPAVRRVARRAANLLNELVAGPLSVFLVAAVGLALLEFLPWPTDIVGWAIAGLRPLNLSFLSMFWTLGVFLAFGFVALSALGVIHALRRWLAFLLLPVSFVILLKVYASASHGALFERLRYLAFLTPVVFFFSLFGFRELAEWAQRWAWPPWWKRVAVLLLVMTFTAWQAPGPREIFRRRQQLPGVVTPGALLAWNQQTEVRYLLDLVTRYPDCVFLAKTVQTAWVADQRTGYQWTAFGAPVRQYREIPDRGESVEQVAEQLAPGSSCVLFYRSLDCDLVGLDGCEAETRGREPLEERVLENLPYSDISEYGAHRAEIRLGVYPVAQ